RRGAERILVETATALSKRGHKVTVFTVAWDPKAAKIPGVRTIVLGRRTDWEQGHEREFARRLAPLLAAGFFHATHSLGHRDADAAVYAARFHPRRQTLYEQLGVPDREFISGLGPEKAVHERVIAKIDHYGCM